jgi:hypothetical protein
MRYLDLAGARVEDEKEVDPTAEAAIRAADTQRRVLGLVREENGNALSGDRARRSRPGARQPLVPSEGAAAGPLPATRRHAGRRRQMPDRGCGRRGTPWSPSGNPIWSVAISTHSMAFREARRQPTSGGSFGPLRRLRKLGDKGGPFRYSRSELTKKRAHFNGRKHDGGCCRDHDTGRVVEGTDP